MQQDHYQKRAKQRGIREPLIQLIITYGKTSPLPGGAIGYRLGGKGADMATKDIKKILQGVNKLRDVVVVASRDGGIMTVHHRTKKSLKFH